MQTTEKKIEPGTICYADVGNARIKLRIRGPSLTQPRRWICEDFETGSWLVLPESKLSVSLGGDDSDPSSSQ